MEKLRRYWFRPEDELDRGSEMRKIVADEYVLISDLAERRKQAREEVTLELKRWWVADGDGDGIEIFVDRILAICFGEGGRSE